MPEIRMTTLPTIPDETLDAAPCPECGGASIRFRGTGKNLQHNWCSRWQEPGHLSEAEIRQRISEEMDRAWPRSRGWLGVRKDG
jgi:hypothetical protein